MNQNYKNAWRARYVALAVIPFALIVATVIGTVAATHVISKAFAEIQASAALTSRHVPGTEGTLVPIPTPQMPGLIAPRGAQTVLSAQSSRMLEKVRVATLASAPKPVPMRSARLVSVPLKAKPAQVAESQYARVAAQ